MSRAAQQRAAIRRLTEALAKAGPVDEVQQIVVDEARRLTNASSSALCLLAEGRDLLDFVAVAGDNAEQIVGLRIRLGDSLSETVIESGVPLHLDTRNPAETGSLFTGIEEETVTLRTPTLARSLSLSELESQTGTHSAIVVPLCRGGRTIGTLSALNKIGELDDDSPAFDADDIETLQMLAEIASASRTLTQTAHTSREQARELTVLYDAAHTIAGSLDVQSVLDSVLHAICTHLEYHTAVLLLLNDERTHLFIAAERGLNTDEREIQFAVQTGLSASVLDTGLPRLIADTDEEPDFINPSERTHSLSAMLAPLRSRDETHGLIMVTSLQRNAYQPDDLKLLAAVSLQAGIAIENAWLYEDAQRQAEEAAALYDLSQHVNATLHLDRVLDFVADSVTTLLKVDKFALLLYDKRTERLVPRLTRSLDPLAFEFPDTGIGEGIAGWVYEWQTPQAVADVAADARNRTAPLDQSGVASTLCVPMHVGEDVIGIIHAMSSKRRLFTVAEMELLYTIANQAAVAIVNAMLYQEARSKSLEMRRYFRRIAHALGSSLDAQDSPQLLADLCVEIIRADRCALYRIEGDTLHLQATSHFRSQSPPDAMVALGSGLSGWVARRGQSLVLTDLSADPRSHHHSWLQRERLTSYLAVPLKAGRRTVGVVEIYTQEPREFTREEVQLLTMFTRRARIAEKIAREPI